MKKRIVSGAAALLVSVALLTSCGEKTASPTEVEITPIEKLNTAEGEINDHA